MLRKILYKFFFKLKFAKKNTKMCVMHVWTIYVPNFKSIGSKWLSYRPKISKMSIGKIFNFGFDRMQHRKMKIAPLNSPSNFASK